MKGILGRKVGMTQLLTARGEVVPVTIIEAGPCYVTQIKTVEKDGYVAVQLGFDETRNKRLSKGQVGHLRRSHAPALRRLREIRLKDVDQYELGQKLSADVFAVNERVDVLGTSKGRGFQGGVKRHGFHGGPKTHGQSDRLRAPGSSSSGTTPGRVYKGKRMAGHMGNAQVTVSNLRVVLVDAERNLLAVRGAVPGAKSGLLLITEARKQG
jgi:large subunit ribosomal protein L3